MKSYYKSRLKNACVHVLQSIYRFAVLLLFLTEQFAIQHHSVLLQNTFLFFFFCDLVKKKIKQNTGILPCLLFAFGIDSASLSFATTSLEISWIGRLPWIEKRISAKPIHKLLSWKKDEWFLNVFSNTDLQRQHKAAILEKYKYHNILQIVQKSSKEILPQISDFTVKLTTYSYFK